MNVNDILITFGLAAYRGGKNRRVRDHRLQEMQVVSTIGAKTCSCQKFLLEIKTIVSQNILHV